MAKQDRLRAGAAKSRQTTEELTRQMTGNSETWETQSQKLQDELEALRAQLGGAIVPSEDGFQIAGFAASSVGFESLEGINPDTWQEMGYTLFRLEGSIQWLIGDWLAHGERTGYGEAKAIANAIGREADTLHGWIAVSRGIELRNRFRNLSHTHHLTVVKECKDPADYRAWLEYAAAEGLSVAKLRKAIREHQIASESASEDAQAPTQQSHSDAARRDIDKNYKVLLTRHDSGNDAERYEIRLDMKSYARQLLQFVVQNAERDTERHDLERELETLLKSLRTQRQIGPRQRALFDGDPDSQS